MTGQAQIIEKAKKLKALADRGVDGEKDNAKRIYTLYKQKHNLTDTQISGYTTDTIYQKETREGSVFMIMAVVIGGVVAVVVVVVLLAVSALKKLAKKLKKRKK